MGMTNGFDIVVLRAGQLTVCEERVDLDFGLAWIREWELEPVEGAAVILWPRRNGPAAASTFAPLQDAAGIP